MSGLLSQQAQACVLTPQRASPTFARPPGGVRPIAARALGALATDMLMDDRVARQMEETARRCAGAARPPAPGLPRASSPTKRAPPAPQADGTARGDGRHARVVVPIPRTRPASTVAGSGGADGAGCVALAPRAPIHTAPLRDPARRAKSHDRRPPPAVLLLPIPGHSSSAAVAFSCRSIAPPYRTPMKRTHRFTKAKAQRDTPAMPTSTLAGAELLCIIVREGKSE